MEIAHLPARIAIWLEEPTPLLQICGIKGAGKTSVLYALMNEFSRIGSAPVYTYVPPDQAPPKLEIDKSPMLVDEAQRLPRRSRLRLYRKALALTLNSIHNPRLILATHEDFSGEFSQFPLEFETIQLTAPGETDLTLLLEKRIQHFASGAASSVRFEPGAVRYLSNKFGDDLRSMETFLYTYFQTIPDQELISVEALTRESSD